MLIPHSEDMQSQLTPSATEQTFLSSTWHEHMEEMFSLCIRNQSTRLPSAYSVNMDRSVSGNQRIRKFHNADLATVPNKSRTCGDKFFLQEFAGGFTPLNVYTGQNPRRHVVLKNTSQMRTICTQFGRNLSVYLSLYVSFFPGGGIFLQIRFSLVKCPSIITFIPSKIRLQYS
jgi:hypothetical protein